VSHANLPCQFQPRLSMAEFMRRFGTQEQCETALTLAR
jgi:hypothetical protein